MPRPIRLIALVSIVTLLTLVGCGGDDDTDPTSTPAEAATATQEPASEAGQTATSPAATVTATTSTDGAGGAASPTGEPTGESSPESEPEPTTVATEAASPDFATPTVTATLEAPPEPTAELTDVEEQLLSILVTQEELPDGWTTDVEAEPTDVEDTDGEELCGAEGFPGEEQSTGQVEVQFLSEDPRIVMLQKVWAYPDDVAAEAFAYWEDQSVCDSWNVDEETVVAVDSVEDPGFADESFAVHLTFESAEGDEITGDYVFIRSDSLLMLIAYLGSADADLASLAEPIEVSVERMQEVAASLEIE